MNFEDSIKVDSAKKGVISMRCTVDPINFSQGKYSISLGFSNKVNGVREELFRYQSAIYFTVKGKTHGWAPIQLQPKWQLLK